MPLHDLMTRYCVGKLVLGELADAYYAATKANLTKITQEIYREDTPNKVENSTEIEVVKTTKKPKGYDERVPVDFGPLDHDIPSVPIVKATPVNEGPVRLFGSPHVDASESTKTEANAGTTIPPGTFTVDPAAIQLARKLQMEKDAQPAEVDRSKDLLGESKSIF